MRFFLKLLSIFKPITIIAVALSLCVACQVPPPPSPLPSPSPSPSSSAPITSETPVITQLPKTIRGKVTTIIPAPADTDVIDIATAKQGEAFQTYPLSIPPLISMIGMTDKMQCFVFNDDSTFYAAFYPPDYNDDFSLDRVLEIYRLNEDGTLGDAVGQIKQPIVQPVEQLRIIGEYCFYTYTDYSFSPSRRILEVRYLDGGEVLQTTSSQDDNDFFRGVFLGDGQCQVISGFLHITSTSFDESSQAVRTRHRLNLKTGEISPSNQPVPPEESSPFRIGYLYEEHGVSWIETYDYEVGQYSEAVYLPDQLNRIDYSVGVDIAYNEKYLAYFQAYEQGGEQKKEVIVYDILEKRTVAIPVPHRGTISIHQDKIFFGQSPDNDPSNEYFYVFDPTDRSLMTYLSPFASANIKDPSSSGNPFYSLDDRSKYSVFFYDNASDQMIYEKNFENNWQLYLIHLPKSLLRKP